MSDWSLSNSNQVMYLILSLYPPINQVNKDGKSAIPENQFEIALSSKITFHDSKALKKCCESLAFLVRDAAHVTPSNFEACVHAIRTFVEATVNGGMSVDQSCCKYLKMTQPIVWGLLSKCDCCHAFFFLFFLGTQPTEHG